MLCSTVKTDLAFQVRIENLNRTCFLHEALGPAQLFDELQVTSSNLCCILQGCISKRDLPMGRRVHHLAVRTGFEHDLFVRRLLINMYAASGELSEGKRLFLQLKELDAFAWMTIISANYKAGEYEQAIELYGQMQQSDIVPDSHIFVVALKSCLRSNDMQTAKLIHSQIIENNGESDVFTRNALIEMHSRFGSLDDACSVFYRFSNNDLVTWAVLIGAYLEHEKPEYAINLFCKMYQIGIGLDKVIAMYILKACASLEALHEGRILHDLILKHDLLSEISVANTIVDMYIKCGSLPDAYRVFCLCKNWDLVTWNAMLSGFVLLGQNEAAFSFYSRLMHQGFTFTLVTFMTILKACSNKKFLHEARWVHTDIIEHHLLSDVSVCNSLIDIYAKCDRLQDADSIFQNLHERTIVTWNTIITGYGQHSHVQEAVRMFQKMLHTGIQPNSVTYVGLVKAFSSTDYLHQGNVIDCYIRSSNLKCDSMVCNALVDMYIRCGSFADALDLFQRIPDKDLTTWNIMISGCVENGYDEIACQQFQQLQCQGVCPDEITYISMLKMKSNAASLQHGKSIHFLVVTDGHESNVLIANSFMDMYCKCGLLEEAYDVFNRLTKENTVTWNIMMEACTLHGFGENACELFNKMQTTGTFPDRVTFISVLRAISSIKHLQKGKRIHLQITESVYANDTFILNSLLDMYSKCGSLGDACDIFDEWPQRDPVLWCSMITLCAKHSNYKLALHYFKEMQQSGLHPTDAAFVSVLSSLGHAGEIGEGFIQFNSMLMDHSVTPKLDHYNCMVDLLGRVGQLDDAETFLQSVPFTSNLIGWMSLLSHSKIHGNVDLARRCFEYLSNMNLGKPAAYVHMSHVYADAGMEKQANELEEVRKSACSWKTPGKAVIEVNNTAHEFCVGEQKHCMIDEVQSLLKEVNQRLKAAGHMPFHI